MYISHACHICADYVFTHRRAFCKMWAPVNVSTKSSLKKGGKERERRRRQMKQPLQTRRMLLFFGVTNILCRAIPAVSPGKGIPTIIIRSKTHSKRGRGKQQNQTVKFEPYGDEGLGNFRERYDINCSDHHSYRNQFVHIPKNAGTTIENIGRRSGYCWGRFATVRGQKKLCNTCEFSSLSACTTRNFLLLIIHKLLQIRAFTSRS